MRAPIGLLLAMLVSPVLAATDADTGLVIAPDWELARAQCGACHSHAVLTQQRGNEHFWDATISRMQTTHGLWTIDAAQRARLVDYLASQYPATSRGDSPGRRPNLPAALRPRPPQTSR